MVDDAATHERVAAILRLMAATLHKDKWWIIRCEFSLISTEILLKNDDFQLRFY